MKSKQNNLLSRRNFVKRTTLATTGILSSGLPVGAVANVNGNNYKEIESVLNKAKTLTGNGKPIVIIMDTEMGNGVDFMMGTHKWHGVAPNDEQLDEALEQNPETIKDY